MNITITADTLNSCNCKNHYLTNEYLGWREAHSVLQCHNRGERCLLLLERKRQWFSFCGRSYLVWFHTAGICICSHDRTFPPLRICLWVFFCAFEKTLCFIPYVWVSFCIYLNRCKRCENLLFHKSSISLNVFIMQDLWGFFNMFL